MPRVFTGLLNDLIFVDLFYCFVLLTDFFLVGRLTEWSVGWLVCRLVDSPVIYVYMCPDDPDAARACDGEKQPIRRL